MKNYQACKRLITETREYQTVLSVTTSKLLRENKGLILSRTKDFL